MCRAAPRPLVCATLVALAVGAGVLQAQRGRGAGQSARAGAAMNLEGYWVSVVSEDWKFRMVTPRKGVFEPVPLNAAGRKEGESWDPARDTAAGEACRAYSAASIMRMPARLHITWEDDNTLRIDVDAGTQTRLLRFGAAPAPRDASWQGHSVAQWQYAPGGRGGARTGSLKVVTTHLRPGYIRRNGAPHSANAVVTEYFDLHTLPNGDRWLTVTTKVEDPEYLSRPYLTSSDFKQLRDASGWSPSPCAAG